MELDRIKIIIEKYFEANTTLAEEETLKAYFKSDQVAPELEPYAPMFNYLKEAKKERFTKQVSLEQPKKRYLKWASVAAIAVFMLSFYFLKPAPATVSLADEYTPEEIASAKEAFALLAMNFNKGTEQLNHLEEFQKNTNKFLIKE